MPRPVSWLSRLHEISRSVDNSVRSNYDRRDLEALFELQPRAAQKLLEMLPSVPIGTSRLVDRQVLSGFLARIGEIDDATMLFEAIRQEKPAPARRKIRAFVRHDAETATLPSYPRRSRSPGIAWRLASGPSKSSLRPCSPSLRPSRATAMRWRGATRSRTNPKRPSRRMGASRCSRSSNRWRWNGGHLRWSGRCRCPPEVREARARLDTYLEETLAGEITEALSEFEVKSLYDDHSESDRVR